MAKRNYTELFFQDIIPISCSEQWSIGKDDTYYYKTLGEQNYAALDGKIEKNLEYMMKEEKHVSGLNPVSDMYYIDESFIAYRTPIVEGEDISILGKQWGLELSNWNSFFQCFISVINSMTRHDYVLSDLYSIGNFLYQEKHNNVVIIDNDGIQVQQRFSGVADFIALETCLRDCHSNFFVSEESYYTDKYNAFAFYSWFYYYFLNIRLPFYLREDIQRIKEVLKKIGISHNPWLWETTLDFFSDNPCTYIDARLFSQLVQNYKIDYDDKSRRLVSR